MYQRREWMKAFVAQDHDGLDSDEQLQEIFEDFGIPPREIAAFLDRRGEESLLSVCN